MSMGDLIVGGVIAIWVIAAIYVLVRNKRKGNSSCGCKCSGCPSANKPNVIVEEDICDCCKKN